MVVISFEPPFLLLLYYRIIGSISILLNTFALYLILFKGVKMDNFKYYLLAFQICCTCADVHVTFLMQPIGLFPMIAGYCNGILAVYFDISPEALVSIADLFNALQTSSLTLCFIRKHQAIAKISKTQQISKPFLIAIIIILIVVSIVIAITFYLSGMTTAEQLAYIISTQPDYYPHFLKLHNFAIYKLTPLITFSMTLIVLHGFICVNVIVLTTSQMFKLLKYNLLRISASSYDKHRSALKSLFAQFLTSSLCLTPPVILSAAIMVEYEKLQVLSHFLLAIFSTHSTANVIVMIITFPAYRRFVLFWKKPPALITTSYSIALRQKIAY
ncbi:unnamed protein product [Caenorhabditis angaria]|uniref:Uncharacterized protein n=1 Tax=Caenorhabditis angaria TaxID=860376 RepID=A0A9P1MSL2_9PELO|nr:unnamed protein product [Caenorhabditis angaria]